MSRQCYLGESIPGTNTSSPDSGLSENIDNFKNKKVIGFAGIGNPKNFFDLLKENKINYFSFGRNTSNK